MRSVGYNGDIVTQSLNHVAQLEWEWARDWTIEFVKFVLEDGEHGEANREVLSGWLGEWLPLAEEAAEGLRAVFADLPAGITYEDGRTNVQIDADELMEASGVGVVRAAKPKR